MAASMDSGNDPQLVPGQRLRRVVVATPPDWVHLDVTASGPHRVRAMLDRAISRGDLENEAAARMSKYPLLSSLRSARRHNVVLVAVWAAPGGQDEPLGASLAVSLVPIPVRVGGEQADAVTIIDRIIQSYAGRDGIADVGRVELPVAPAARLVQSASAEAGNKEPGPLTVQYFVPVPGARVMVTLTFTSLGSKYGDRLVELFDVMATSLGLDSTTEAQGSA